MFIIQIRLVRLSWPVWFYFIAASAHLSVARDLYYVSSVVNKLILDPPLEKIVLFVSDSEINLVRILTSQRRLIY